MCWAARTDQIRVARSPHTTSSNAPLSETSSGGRNSSLENIFGVRSVAQIPPPSEKSLTTASCCTWFRKTGDNNCFQRALCRCAISTVQPEKLVAQSCTFCGTVLIPSRTDNNPDTRMQRPMARPPFSNLLRARCRCSQVTPWTTARFQTAPLGTLSSPHRARQAGTCRASPTLRDGTPALRCLSIRHGMRRKASKEP